MDTFDENTIRIIMMNITDKKSLKNFCDSNKRIKKICSKFKKEWDELEWIRDMERFPERYERSRPIQTPEEKEAWLDAWFGPEREESKSGGYTRSLTDEELLEQRGLYRRHGFGILPLSPRKKGSKKCPLGKVKNTVTGGCRRKCKVGKEKIGSDGKCVPRKK